MKESQALSSTSIWVGTVEGIRGVRFGQEDTCVGVAREVQCRCVVLECRLEQRQSVHLVDRHSCGSRTQIREVPAGGQWGTGRAKGHSQEVALDLRAGDALLHAARDVLVVVLWGVGVR